MYKMEFKKGFLRLYRFSGIEEYPIKKAQYSLDSDESMPLNGKLINGKDLQILVNCGDSVTPESFCDNPGLVIEIHATHEKLKGFELYSENLQFPEYVCNDEWEVMATLDCYSSNDIRNGVIEVLSISKESVELKISGDICDVDYYDNSKPRNIIKLHDDFKLGKNVIYSC